MSDATQSLNVPVSKTNNTDKNNTNDELLITKSTNNTTITFILCLLLVIIITISYFNYKKISDLNIDGICYNSIAQHYIICINKELRIFHINNKNEPSEITSNFNKLKLPYDKYGKQFIPNYMFFKRRTTDNVEKAELYLANDEYYTFTTYDDVNGYFANFSSLKPNDEQLQTDFMGATYIKQDEEHTFIGIKESNNEFDTFGYIANPQNGEFKWDALYNVNNDDNNIIMFNKRINSILDVVYDSINQQLILICKQKNGFINIFSYDAVVTYTNLDNPVFKRIQFQDDKMKLLKDNFPDHELIHIFNLLKK